MKFDQRRERGDAARLNWCWCTFHYTHFKPGLLVRVLTDKPLWPFLSFLMIHCVVLFSQRKVGGVRPNPQGEKAQHLGAGFAAAMLGHLLPWHWAFRRKTNKTKPTAAVTFPRVHLRSTAHSSWTLQICRRSEFWGAHIREHVHWNNWASAAFLHLTARVTQRPLLTCSPEIRSRCTAGFSRSQFNKHGWSTVCFWFSMLLLDL